MRGLPVVLLGVALTVAGILDVLHAGAQEEPIVASVSSSATRVGAVPRGSFIVFGSVDSKGAVLEFDPDVPDGKLEVRHTLDRKYLLPEPIGYGAPFPPNFFQRVGLFKIYHRPPRGPWGYSGGPFHLDLKTWEVRQLFKCHRWDFVGRTRRRGYFVADRKILCFDARSGQGVGRDCFASRIAEVGALWLVRLDWDIPGGKTGSYVGGAIYDPDRTRIVRKVRLPIMATIINGDRNLREKLAVFSPEKRRLAWMQAGGFADVTKGAEATRLKGVIAVLDLENGSNRLFGVSCPGWKTRSDWASVLPIRMEFPEENTIRFSSLGQVSGGELQPMAGGATAADMKRITVTFDGMTGPVLKTTATKLSGERAIDAPEQGELAGDWLRRDCLRRLESNPKLVEAVRRAVGRDVPDPDFDHIAFSEDGTSFFASYLGAHGTLQFVHGDATSNTARVVESPEDTSVLKIRWFRKDHLDNGQLGDAEAADLVESAVGKRPIVARSSRFRIVSLRGEEEARELLNLCERVHGDFVKLMGDKPGTRYWGATADEFIVESRQQYLALADKVMPRYIGRKDMIAFSRGQTSAWWPRGPFGLHDASRLPVRNALVYHASQYLICRAVQLSKHQPLWPGYGFAWNQEQRYTKSIRFAFRIKKVYGDSGESDASPGTLARWSNALALCAADGSLMSFAEVNNRKYMNEWDTRTQAHIWALVRFLVDEHPDRFAKYLKLMRTKPSQEAFHEAFGWTAEQVDRHWHAWVGRTFDKIAKD